MSINHAHARTIADANPAALAWVRADQGGQTPEVFGLETVLRAFDAGRQATQLGKPVTQSRTPEMDLAADKWLAANPFQAGSTIRDIAQAAFSGGWCGKAAELMGPLRNAVALLAEAGQLFRSYEANHLAKVKPEDHGQYSARREKAQRNGGMAQRIEDLLKSDTTPRDTLAALAAELVHDLDDLIGNSEGVAGLHKNGDLAPWHSLTEGGAFETWLMSLDAMRAGLDAIGMPETRMAEEPAADDLSLARVGDRLADTSAGVYGPEGRDEAIRVLMQSFDGCSNATSREHQIARGAVVDLIAKTLGLTYEDRRTDRDAG